MANVSNTGGGNTGEGARRVNITNRQRQLLQGLADGKSMKVLAHEWQVSYHTIDTHRKELFRRINVNSSTAAVAWAFRNGVIK